MLLLSRTELQVYTTVEQLQMVRKLACVCVCVRPENMRGFIVPHVNEVHFRIHPKSIRCFLSVTPSQSVLIHTSVILIYNRTLDKFHLFVTQIDISISKHFLIPGFRGLSFFPQSTVGIYITLLFYKCLILLLYPQTNLHCFINLLEVMEIFVNIFYKCDKLHHVLPLPVAISLYVLLYCNISKK